MPAKHKKILVIAAHPDDEVLGCGGTIARHAQEGDKINIIILGEGVTSRFDKREQADNKLLEELKSSCYKVADFLGAEKVTLYNLPDNRFDSVPLLDTVKMIEGVVDKIKPDIVYTQHGGDLNIDHVITFRATLTATRPVPGNTVKELYSYEVPSSTEWSFQEFEPTFKPNFFVDISKTIDKKVEAMKIYDAECRAFPHPRSVTALHSNAQKWGSNVGVEAAEAFCQIRRIIS